MLGICFKTLWQNRKKAKEANESKILINIESNDGLWRFKVLSLPLCMVEIFDNIKMFFHLAN